MYDIIDIRHSEERSDEESPTMNPSLAAQGILPAALACATLAKSARYAQSDMIM